MIPPEEILNIPVSYRWLDYAWGILTSGDTLFRALCEAIRNGPVDEIREWVDKWKPFFEGDYSKGTYNNDPRRIEKLEKRFNQWHTARKLVWCAGQAAKYPDFYQTEIDRICFAITELPEFIYDDKVWAWTCIRTFLDIPYRSIEVPVAAWGWQRDGHSKGSEGNEDYQTHEEGHSQDADRCNNGGHKERDNKGFPEGGFIATLRLEIIERGTGQCFHHPADIFSTDMDESFLSAMEDAWISARELLNPGLPRIDQKTAFSGIFRG